MCPCLWASALTFASALTLTLQFLIFAYLYSFHRARFFHSLLLAWDLMSLAKGLHLARAFVPDLDVLSALINATFFVSTLLVLAGGLAFRTDYRIGPRDVLICVLAGLAAAGIGDLSDATVAARSLVGVPARSVVGAITGGILIVAGLQFWPRRAQSLGYRGPRFLAVALTLWGLHRMVSPFIDGGPGTGPHVMMHAAFMVFYFLCTFAIIIVVLDRARSETATLKDWSVPIAELGEGARYFKYDPAEAKRLLTAAGYPNGFPASLCFTSYGSTMFVDTAQLLLKYLKDVGIATTLDQREYGAFIASCYFGKFDSLTYGPQTPFVDPDNYVYGMHYPDELKNQSHVNDPVVTDLLVRQRRTVDPARRREILAELQRHLARQQYYVQRASPVIIAVWDGALKNYGPNLGYDYGGRLVAAWLDR